MAEDNVVVNLAPNNLCKGCKSKAVTGPKCIVCDSIVHKKCVQKLKHVKVIDENTINCCDREATKSVSEMDTCEGKDQICIETSLLKTIINEKDVVIHELRDKIKLLQEKINLLEVINNLQNKCKQIPTPSMVKITNPENSCSNKTAAIDNNYTYAGCVAEAQGDRYNKLENFKSKETLSMETKQKLIMNKFINLNKENEALPLASNTGKVQDRYKENSKTKNTNNMDETSKQVPAGEWSVVDYRKKNRNQRKRIVGTNTEDNVQEFAEKRKFWLFATRFKTTYTCDKLMQYLQRKFPGQQFYCEAIPNKGEFNSFKI